MGKKYTELRAYEKQVGMGNRIANKETYENEEESQAAYERKLQAEEADRQRWLQVNSRINKDRILPDVMNDVIAKRTGIDTPVLGSSTLALGNKMLQNTITKKNREKLDESNFIKEKQLEQNESRQNSVLYDKLMSIASADQYKAETGASKQKAEDDARAALDAAEKAYNKKYQQNVSRKAKVTGSTRSQNFDAELDLLRQDLENKKKSYDQASQDNYNYKTSALGFRNANLYDTTIGSVKRGLLNSRAGEAAYKTFIQNNPNYKDMFGNSYEDFNNELNGEEYKFTANNPVSSAVSGWAELVGQGIYQKANARAVLSAIAGAATAYKASMMNQNVSPTQKRAQAAAGFMLGLNAASSVSNMEIEAGQAYLEMVDKGISDETAKKMAAVVGGVNGILEFMQADEVAKAFFVLDSNPATKSLAKTIKQEAIDRGLDVLNETLQEVAQEGTTIAGVNLAGLKDLGRQVYTDYEVKDRLKDTAISSALSFGAGNIITGGINYATGGVNGAVYKYRNLQNLGKNSDIKTAEDVQTIIDAIDTDPEAYTIDGVVDENLMKKATDLKAYAEKVEQKLEAGGELTTNEKARLEQGQIDLVQSVSEATGSQVEYNPEAVNTPNAEETSRNEENTVSVEEKLRSIANDVATEQVAKQEAEIERIMSEKKSNEAPAAEVKTTNNEVKNTETKMTQDTAVPYNVLSNKARISLEEQLYGKEEVNGKGSNREEWKISLGGYERLTESQQASYRQQIVRRKEIRNLQQTSYVERRSSDLTPIGTESTVRVANKEFVKNNKWAAKIVADNAAQGIRTTLVFDDIKVDEGYGEYDARAYISDDRKHIIVNVNNPAFTAEQLNDHERFHREVSIDPSIMKSVKAKLSNYTDKQLSDMAEAYEATYMFMDDVDKVLEEIFADVYADMFLPEGVFTNENIRDKVVSSVSEAKSNKEVQRGPPVSDKIANERNFASDYDAVAKRAKRVGNTKFSRSINFDEKQQKNYEYNQKQTEVGAKLKTLNGSAINRSNKYGVGKEIGGQVYFHKDYASSVVDSDSVAKAKSILEREYPGFEYNAMMYYPAKNELRFDQAAGFDTQREPLVGDTVTVNLETGATKKGHSNYIWHHKWLWVKNDYSGFDVSDSWEWSKEWLSTLTEVADGNGIERWNAQLERFGLPKDSKAKYSRSISYEETKPIEQAATSANTSRNQVAALFKDKNVSLGKENIDIGGGRWDAATEYLKAKGTNNTVFDPYNREESHNKSVFDKLKSGYRFDTATNTNVLNVISSEEGRANVILEMAKSIKPDGVAYFSVYEGNKTGNGTATRDGWQENRPTWSYIDEIKKYFDDVQQTGKEGPDGHKRGQVIIAKKPKNDLPKASWEMTPGKAYKFSRSAPTSDTSGRELTSKQQEYFENGIKDNSGNLLVLYHGTPSGGFETFKDWTYLTANKSYADRYQNGSASSLKSGKEETNKMTYEVYAKADHIFDTRNKEERDIFNKEFYRKYGTGTPLMESGVPDWTDGEDLIEFFNDNGYDYDAIVLDEGGDGGYGEAVTKRGLSYLIKDSGQIKVTDNKYPTNNRNIKFSRSIKPNADVTYNDELIAVHNLFESDMNKLFRLGGLPMPSIAVTKASMGHDKFGNISLVFGRKTIDPEYDARNYIYSADAYTPTFPSVDIEANTEVQKKLSDLYYNLRNKYGEKFVEPLYSYAMTLDHAINRDGGEIEIVDTLKDNTGFMQIYRVANGQEKIEDVSNTKTQKMSDAEVEACEFFINKIGDKLKEYQEFAKGEKQVWVKDNEALLRNALRDWFIEEQGFEVEEANEASKDERLFKVLQFVVFPSVEYMKNGAEKTETIVDTEATEKAIRDSIDQSKYEKWLKDLFKGAEKSRGIRNDKDAFTANGNRRSFSQTHYPVTLNNVVKYMLSGEQSGISMGGTSITGAAPRKYKSIEDARSDSGRLRMMSNDEFISQQHNWHEQFSNLATRLAKSDYGYDNSSVWSDAKNIMGEAVSRYGTDRDKLASYIKIEGKGWTNYSDSIVDELIDIVNGIRKMPTGYFEAKPRRAVKFDEVLAAVVPNDLSEDTMQSLSDNNINTVTYEAGNEADRAEKLRSISGAKFSRSAALDKQYMDAVNSGDMEVARKMVDEAADKWGAFKDKDGKPLKLYHGTDNGEFYTFDIKRSGSNYDNWGRLGKGIYLTPSKSDAKIWAEKGKGQKNTRIIEAYIKMDNPLNIYDECPKDIKEYVHENFAKKYGWSEFAEKFVTNAGYRFIDYIQNEEKLDARNVLKELGYDGAYSDNEYVVYNSNQVKSAEAETHDKNGNVIPLSERFNDTNEDIRYSRSSDFSPMSIGEQEAKNYETLLASSPALRAASNKLTHALKYTDHIVDTNQVKALAKELIDKNGSKIKVTELTNMISDLYQLIHDQYQIDGDEVTSVSMYIADAVLNNSKRVYDDNDIKRYKEFKNELKKHKINITPEIIAAFGDKQSFMDFRKKYFGTINFVKEGGRGIDEVYSSLRQFYSDILPEELNGENEMRNIEAALETLAPQPILVGEDYYNEQIDISSQIFNKYFDTAFIPKAEGKDVRAYIKEYNTAIEEYKKNLELEYQQAKRELQNEKAKYRQAIKDAEEDKFNFITNENEKLNKAKLAIQSSADRQIAEAKAIAKKIANQRIAEARAYNDKQSAKKTIMRDVNALSKMLTNPTDAKHVPENLRKPLAQFLSLIDFSSSRTLPDGTETRRTMAWMDMAKAMSDIEKNGGVYVYPDGSTQYYEIDPDIIATMDDLKDKIAGINKLDNLTMDELRDLRNTVQAMKKTIGDANRMISSERGASVSEVTEGSISELKSFKKYREFVGWLGTIKNLLSSKMLSADTRFHTFGKNAEEVYRPIREGFNVKVRHTQEAVEYFAKLKEEAGVTDKEINEWGNDKAEKITITTENGQTLSLKPAQAMSLYELWKRPQAQKHITDGGVITKDVIKSGVVKEKVQSEITPLTEKDIKKIAEQLTDKQKALADGITKFFRRTAEWGNNASLKMFGYRKFNDGAYFPIKVDRNTLHTTSEGNVKGDTVSIKNAGFTKEVKKDAANPLILLDIVDVFTDQVNGMSNYDAFLAPMSDLLKWYNYKGQGYDTIKSALEHAYGSAATSYVHQFISDLNGFQNTDKYFANNMVGMFKGAAVGANLSVAIQQPTSYARALAVMEPKYLIAGLNAMKKSEIGDYENVLKYSGIAQWKDWGFYETDIGKSMRTIVTSTGELKAVTNKKEFMQWLNNAQMTLAEKGDKITWAALWKASEAKIKDTTDLTPGTDEFYKATAKVFDNIIDRTQVVDSLFSRAEIMRSKNDLTKMAVSFMNEPMKSYNSLAWASFDLATAKDKQTKQKAAKSFAAAGVAFILSNVLAAAAKSLVTALRNKDKDKKFLERYWEAFSEEALGNLMPWNYIPYIKDIYSIFQGYDVERTDMTGIVELYDAFNRWKKFFEGESKYSLGSNMLYSLKALSNLTGIAYYGFYRDFDALLTESLHALDAQEALYEKEKLTGEKLAVGNTYAKMALKAYASGNPTLGNKIVNELMTVDENGKLDDKLKDMMKKDTALAKLVYSNTGKEDVHYTAAEAIFSAAKNGETKKKESVDILLKLDISKEDKEYLYEKHYTTKELTEWKQNGGSTYDFMTSGSEMDAKVSEEKAAGSAGDSAVANAALDMIQSGTSKDVVGDLYYQKTKDDGFKEYTDNGGSAEKYIKGEKEYYGLVEKAREDDGKLSDPELYDIALQMLNSGTDEDVVKYLYNKQKEHNPIDDWDGSTKEYFEDAKEISEHKQTITNGGRSTNATKKQIADKIKTMVSDEDARKVLWELAGYSVDSTKDGQVIDDGNYNKYFK